MGNEMGNNNTSGLREEDNIIEDKSVQKLDHADDLKVKETEHEEKDNLITEGKISPEDAARTDYKKEQDHEAVASEDIYVNEKEEDSDMILIDEEKIMQEYGHAEEAKEQDILVPAAEDKNTEGNEMELSSLEQDGLVSSRIEDRKCDEKEQENSTVLEVDEIPLKGGASIDEPNEEGHLVLAGGDESTHENETGLVFGDRDVMEHPCVDKQNHDEKALKGAEEDIIINDEAEEQSSQEASSADVLDIQGQLLAVVEDKATDRNEADLVSTDPEGTAKLTSDNPIYLDNEEDNNMIPVGKENSMQEAGYVEEAKGQDHLVQAAKDKNNRENETEPTSLEHAGLASPHIEGPEHDEKGQDTSTYEIPSTESANTEETNAEARLVPAGGDGSIYGTETGIVSGERDPCVDKQKHDEKDYGITINDEAKEQSSQEAVSTDELDIQCQLLAVLEDKTTHENETGLVCSGPKGTVDLHGDNPKDHEKEKDDDMIPVDTEKSTQEAGYAEEAKGQDHLVPVAEDKTNRGNEMESASLEHDSLVSPRTEDQQHDEKAIDAKDTSRDEISLKDCASTDETNAVHLVPACGDGSTRGTETGMVSGNQDGRECVDKLKHDNKEEDITINFEAEKQSSEEAASTDIIDIQGQLLDVVEDRTTNRNETDLVSSDTKQTTDLHGDNPKEHEKEVNNTNAETQENPLAKDYHEDDIEEKNPTFPAAEGAAYNDTKVEPAASLVEDTFDNQILEGKEGKTEPDAPAESAEVDAKPSEVVKGSETQPASSSKNSDNQEMQKETNSEENLSERTRAFENQNSMKEEDEGTRNSISDAACSTSDDFVPQEPVEVLEHELAEIRSEQLVLEDNGPSKSEDVIIPSSTCRDQENGFVLDSSGITDPVKSVFPDRSPEVSNESDEFLVKEMSNEEKIELKAGDEPGDDLVTITTGLPKEFGAKCNGVLPSNMNSIQSDSPESQGEAVHSDETRNILVEVSETQDKDIVHSQEGTSVKEESGNGNRKQSQYEEESIKKPNGQRSEEGLKANDQNGFSSQFLQAKILENGHLIDATINHQNEQQKGSQQVQLVTDSADTFLMVQKNKEEEPEENKIIEEMVQNKNDSTPTENDTPRRENGEQKSLPLPHDPIEQVEAFLVPSPFLQALPDKQMHESDLESKKVENSNEYSIAEVKQESSGEFPTAEVSFINKNLTEKIVVANGDYTQRETMGRLSIESNPDNTTINAQMRKSPSFDLDLRIDARSEDHSDQTPLLYQDKATIDSFSSQADVAVTKNGENPSQYESMEAQEKTVTLERSDTEKSRTPFLGFLKEDEEADNNMLLNPKKQDNDSATKNTTAKVSVSAKDVTSVATKGKVKRKPRTSLFGTCMCCATV